MNTLDIQNALDAQLQTITNLPTLQTENNRFNASTNIASWVRSTLMPAQSSVLAIGPNALTQMQGFYQVDVFYPADTGITAARTLADTIVSTFPVGLRLVGSSGTVIVDVTSVITAYSINKYYCIPVRIQWSVFG